MIETNVASKPGIPPKTNSWNLKIYRPKMTSSHADALLAADELKAVPRCLWTFALYLTIMALGVILGPIIGGGSDLMLKCMGNLLGDLP